MRVIIVTLLWSEVMTHYITPESRHNGERQATKVGHAISVCASQVGVLSKCLNMQTMSHGSSNGSNTCGVGKICNFQQITHYILKRVQDKHSFYER